MELAKVVKFVPKEEEKKEAPKRKSKGKGTRADGRKQIRRVVGHKESGEPIAKSFYGKTLKEAEAKYQAYMAEERAGINRELQNTTVAQWANTWLDVYTVNVKPSTRYRYQVYVKKLARYFEGVKLRDVRASHANQFIATLAGSSSSQISAVLGIAKAVFETAIDEKIITDNPFGRVKKPKGTAGTHRSLSNDEVQWMCDHWHEYRMGLAYMVMIFAGLRIGEVVALNPQDIDLENRTITVNKGMSNVGGHYVLSETKTKSSNRQVPIFEPLYRALKERGGQSIFTRKDGKPFQSPASCENASREIGAAMERDGLKTIRPHDGRHTMRTLLFAAGVPDPVAEEFMGHAKVGTVEEVYRHITDEMRRKAIASMEKYCARFLRDSDDGNCGQIVVKPKTYRLSRYIDRRKSP